VAYEYSTVSEYQGTVYRVTRFPELAVEKRFWSGRFDSPQRSFSTVYAASSLRAALYEVLVPFRPDPAVIRLLDQIEGEPDRAFALSRGLVSGLFVMQLELDGRFVLSEESGRGAVSERSELQKVAQSVFEQGFDGIIYRSAFSGEALFAVFSASHLRVVRVEPLDPGSGLLAQVGVELGVTIEA
jgi:hypothetical protein